MKIENSPVLMNKNSKAIDKDEEGFGDRLGEKREKGDVKVRLKNLLERIDVQGQRLAERMDVSELREYKRLIGEFLNISVNNSHKFSKESFLDGKGRHRIFHVVKKVNDELDNLTKEIIDREKKQLNVLARIDDIRGMLLDIIT